MMRAVHRLEEKPLAILELNRRELAVAVIWVMSGELVEFDVGDIGRVDGLVAPLTQLAADVIFDRLTHDGPLRQPKNECRANGLHGCGEFALVAKYAVP